MKSDDAVLVATFANEYEADLAVSWLEAEGISALVLSDDAGGALPNLQSERGVKILVAPENEALAREVLTNAATGDDPGNDSDDDPTS